MGRPKGSKNKKKLVVPSVDLFDVPKVDTEPITHEVESKQDTTKQKKVDKYKKCELCGNLIYSSPYVANLSYLTGSAGYKREIPDLVRMCNDCATEFSSMVETWMLKKGLPIKYGYKRDDNDYAG